MKALFDTYGGMLAKAIAIHTGYVLISTAAGFLLGLLLGILLSRLPTPQQPPYVGSASCFTSADEKN